MTTWREEKEGREYRELYGDEIESFAEVSCN